MPTLAPAQLQNTHTKMQLFRYPEGKVKYSQSYFVLFSQKYQGLPLSIKTP